MSARSLNQPFRSSQKSYVGWGVVALVHLLAFYLLVSGMAKKGLHLISKPLKATVIQEVILPPPPSPPPPKEIRKVNPDVFKKEPDPFVPPPEVSVPASHSTIAAVATPPVVMPEIAPPAVAHGPSKQEIGMICPKQVKPEMPVKAIREGLEGVVRAQILVQNGNVKEVTILSGPRVFHAAVKEAMLQYRCIAGTETVTATQEFSFKLDQ